MFKKLLLSFCVLCLLTGAVAAKDLPAKWDIETDVLVVGFGAAGSAAASAAHDAGADVLIIEKLPFPGGNTALCGGAVYAAGTDIQKQLGYNDTPELMQAYQALIKPGLNRPEFIKLVSERSNEALEWIIANGAKIPAKEGVPGITMGGFERNFDQVTPAMPRSHWVEGGGKGLFQAFFNAVSKRKIKTSMSTTAERLIRDPASDRIVGVQATKNKKTIYIKANKAVVLTTGGFSQNIEMLTAYAPSGNNYKGAKGSSGVVGDGIKMAQEVGADLWAMHETLESMGILGAPNAYFTPFMEYTLIVNNKGLRFISEGAWTEPISEETLRQPDGEAFLIFDATLRARSEFDTTLGSVVPTKFLVEANSLEELAVKFGIPGEAFLKTVADYNGYCESGVDPLGKTRAELFALTKAPFYGIKSNPLPVMTTGGLLTDTGARVLNSFKEPIPGLYAAGEVTGGKLVGYPGCGTAVTDATIFGLIAGENAAAEKAWK